MKKQKYYLAAGALACSAISGLAMPLSNTFAEGTGSQTRDVTVGEVDGTIYSVDINWGDMIFDWKYNEETNRFGFQHHSICHAVSTVADGIDWLESEKNNGNIYSDESCMNVFTDEIAYNTTYYYRVSRSEAVMDVTDRSTNGKVKVKASFTPTDNYSWVSGRFSSIAYLAEQGGYSQDLDDGYLKAVAGNQVSTVLNGILYLEGDNTHVTSDAVHAGDKIGTITLTIEPDLN